MTQTKVRPEPRYPVGMAAFYAGRRVRIIGRKWSAPSWWYELRDDQMHVASIPEIEVRGTED